MVIDDRGGNDDFRCTSCKVSSFFTYRGFNQHFRTCLGKARGVVVTASQPASSRATNHLQNKAKPQQRQNTTGIASEEYTNI